MTQPDRDPVLTVTELTKTYGGKRPLTAVDRLSFALGRGEILGLLGPNGAGKTTTIQMLLSTLTPTSGRIAYFGRSLEAHREEILEQVGFASAYSKLPTHLRIDENLDVFGRLYGLPAAERASRSRALLERFGVWDLRKRIMAGLSAGQTTRVMLAKAFLTRPRVVLLDEPTASLDPDIAHEVREFVLETRDRDGVSILYTSHNMDEVAQICDRVLFLDKGKIAAVGTPDELAASAAATRLTLRVDRGLGEVLRHAADRGLAAQVNDGMVDLEIDERQIAEFLSALAGSDVRYAEIHLDKPTLEDYFLKLARRAGAGAGNGAGGTDLQPAHAGENGRDGGADR
jgi:ABC-2 type transport system ATP-binding protein